MARTAKVSDDQILEAVYDAPERKITTQELISKLEIYPARVNSLIDGGTLKVSRTVKVTGEDGNPSRGRPHHVLGLTKRSADRLRRRARKAQAA